MFTEEQNQYFESVFKSKMQDCTLEFVWEVQDKEETPAKEHIQQENTDVWKKAQVNEARNHVASCEMDHKWAVFSLL